LLCGDNREFALVCASPEDEIGFKVDRGVGAKLPDLWEVLAGAGRRSIDL
jgi:hypothetical protein